MTIKRTPPSMTHEELVAKMLENENVRREYERLENSGEFKLLDEILAARKTAGLTQAQVAERMKTKVHKVARLESALMSGKNSLSMGELKKYANAVGKKLEVHFV
jgi:ribosome-binding protein aMBF1 (putative translation factor)